MCGSARTPFQAKSENYGGEMSDRVNDREFFENTEIQMRLENVFSYLKMNSKHIPGWGTSEKNGQELPHHESRMGAENAVLQGYDRAGLPCDVGKHPTYPE
jgi:hypothetical protein